MNLLAVDTCLGACSVALLRDDAVLAHQYQDMARGHAEALAPMVERALAGHDPAALDRLAVTVGPGTFTGQRVGLAFMRGLKLAIGRPLIGVTSLEAMALAASAQTGARKCAALHDARRGEVYLALVENGEMIMAPRVMIFADALVSIRAFGSSALAGTAAPAAKEALGEGFTLSAVRQPDALFVARLAQTRPVPDHVPSPLYLRAPDARLPTEKARPLNKDDDLAALAALHALAFDRPGDRVWDATALKELLAMDGSYGYATSAGFVLARAAADEAEILTLAVAPLARGRGHGRALVRQAAEKARQAGASSLFLEVATDNDAALALYGGLGFQHAGLRKGYYQGRDALVLKAMLPLSPDLA